MAYFTKEDVKNINALVISLVVFAIFALGFWLGGVDWFVTRNEEPVLLSSSQCYSRLAQAVQRGNKDKFSIVKELNIRYNTCIE
ncbi:hypothetical protein VPHD47_0168 [Vibrio phage D47]